MAKTKIVQVKKAYRNEQYPIMLRMTHQRKANFISLGMKCRLDQWNNETSRFKKNYPSYQSKNKLLRKLEVRADETLDYFTTEKIPFTFKAFEDEFTTENAKFTTVFDFLEKKCEKLKVANKVNTRGTYKQTLNHLKNFYKGSTLLFEDIDYTFLKKFEVYLFSNGCSGGGVHFYMRTIRATINDAIKEEYMSKSHYPFSTQFNDKGYSIKDLKSKASPRALSIEDMNKFKNFSVSQYPQYADAFYYFLFSYYARGMNFTDMAMLKWSDINNNRIVYNRSKTSKNLNIGISDPIQKILDYYKGYKPVYVFPILYTDRHKTKSQIKYRIRKCLKQFNKELKEIGALLGFSAPLTSYVSRHTYAQTLKENKVDISVISEALGHSNVNTTKAYLKQFDNDVIDEADKVL